MMTSPEPDRASERSEIRSAAIDASYAAYDALPHDEPDEWGDLASFREAASAQEAESPGLTPRSRSRRGD
jgi:hypothetical protein